jgi:hypothetical protein
MSLHIYCKQNGGSASIERAANDDSAQILKQNGGQCQKMVRKWQKMAKNGKKWRQNTSKFGTLSKHSL